MSYTYSNDVTVLPLRVGQRMYTRSIAELTLSLIYGRRCFEITPELTSNDGDSSVVDFGVVEFFSPCFGRRIRVGAVVVNYVTIQSVRNALALAREYKVPFVPVFDIGNDEGIIPRTRPPAYLRIYVSLQEVVNELEPQR